MRPGEPLPLLAIDTCLGACSAAVAVDGVVRAARYEERRTGHAEAIVPMIEAVLANAGVTPKSLKRIAVTIGPGTFAGMRIGLAAAEGLSLATGATLVPVSSLWAIGQRVIAERGLSERPLAVAVDAGRGQVYIELLGPQGAHVNGPQLLAIAEASAIAGQRSVLRAGSGAGLLTQGAEGDVLAGAIEPRASDFAVAASALPVATGPVRPLYFRPADAVVQSAPELRA